MHVIESKSILWSVDNLRTDAHISTPSKRLNLIAVVEVTLTVIGCGAPDASSD